MPQVNVPDAKPLEVVLDVAFTAAIAFVAYLFAGSLLPAAVKMGGLTQWALAIAAGWYAFKWARSHKWLS